MEIQLTGGKKKPFFLQFDRNAAKLRLPRVRLEHQGCSYSLALCGSLLGAHGTTQTKQREGSRAEKEMEILKKEKGKGTNKAC